MLKVSKVLTAAPTGSIYLNVPYKDKDQAKALGARWDPEAKKWYTAPQSLQALSQWANPSDLAEIKPPAPQAGPPPVHMEETDKFHTLQYGCPRCKASGNEPDSMPYYQNRKKVYPACRVCRGDGVIFKDVIVLTAPVDHIFPALRIPKLRSGQYYINVDNYTPGFYDQFVDPAILMEIRGKAAEKAEVKRIEAEESAKRQEAYAEYLAQRKIKQEEAKVIEKERIQREYMITIEEARAQGLTIGTDRHSCANSGDPALPQYFPGDAKVPAHKHLMEGSSSTRGYSYYSCRICGASSSCDSGD